MILDPFCVLPWIVFCMHSMDVCECNMPCVCKNASMSVNPLDCDDMLHESLGVLIFLTSNS